MISRIRRPICWSELAGIQGVGLLLVGPTATVGQAGLKTADNGLIWLACPKIVRLKLQRNDALIVGLGKMGQQFVKL